MIRDLFRSLLAWLGFLVRPSLTPDRPFSFARKVYPNTAPQNLDELARNLKALGGWLVPVVDRGKVVTVAVFDGTAMRRIPWSHAQMLLDQARGLAPVLEA